MTRKNKLIKIEDKELEQFTAEMQYDFLLENFEV